MMVLGGGHVGLGEGREATSRAIVGFTRNLHITTELSSLVLF